MRKATGRLLAGAAAAVLLVAAALGAMAPSSPQAAPFNGYVLAGTTDGFRVGFFGLDGTLRRTSLLSLDPGDRCQIRGVCFTPDGTLWLVAWANARKNLYHLGGTGLEIAALSVLGPDRCVKTVAAAPGGDLVLAFQNQSRIARFRPSSGSLVWDCPTGPLPRGLAVAGDGSIWVASKGANTRDGDVETGRLARYGADGRKEVDIEVPLGARGVAVDADGNCWVAILGQQAGVAEVSDSSGDDNRVIKVAPDGTVLRVAEVGRGPFAIACDAWGAAYVVCSRDESVRKLRPDGSPDPAFGSAGRVDLRLLAPHPLSVALDGEGAIWVASKYSGRMEEKRPVDIVRLDGGTGAVKRGFPVRFPYALGPETLGDLCGYHLANIVDPDGDMDHDGVPNREELLAGTNPFDPRSRSSARRP